MKRIKVAFVLGSEWRVDLWFINPNIHMEQELSPNVFTANYIVAIPRIKAPFSSWSSDNVAPVLSKTFQALVPEKPTLYSRTGFQIYFSAESVFKRIKSKARDYQHLWP